MEEKRTDTGAAVPAAPASPDVAAPASPDAAAAALPSLPWDRDVVETILPHRDPFVWVSRVTEIEPGRSITAELDVPVDLDIFRGHFPDHPVLPGVIIMEALAQAASIAILVDPSLRGSIGFLTGIDKAKFRRQVAPGETVTLRGTILKSSRRLCVAEVEASVDGQVCATATQKYVLAPKEENHG